MWFQLSQVRAIVLLKEGKDRHHNCNGDPCQIGEVGEERHYVVLTSLAPW